jgi:hypothetical protein
MGGHLPGNAYDHDKFTAKMLEHDKEVAAELEHARQQLTASASAADHHVAAENAIQGISEGVEQVKVAAS